MPGWFKTWEQSGLLAWYDHNQDGKVQYAKGAAVEGKPVFSETPGSYGERVVTNPSAGDVHAGAPYANEPFAEKIEQNWLFGITPQAIGGLGMLLNFLVALTVSRLTPEPPVEVQEMVESLRVTSGAGEAVAH